MRPDLNASDASLKLRFTHLHTLDDLAGLLEVRPGILAYYLYNPKALRRYREFDLKKRNGGVRKVAAPEAGLKCLQAKLSRVLQLVYTPRMCVYGFVRNGGIRKNALAHVGKRYVLNIDLENFFPSIHFGRVRGVLVAHPYSLSPDVAKMIANLCCFNGSLPQGAPSSPVISNMVAYGLDVELHALSKGYSCIYTRYADDITISTSRPTFPEAIAAYSSRPDGGSVVVGPHLQTVIRNHDFRINFSKVRLQTQGHQQSVTGITVNRKANVARTYIRTVRAMLNEWGKHGLKNAGATFLKKHSRRQRFPGKGAPDFSWVVRGRIEHIGHVRGKKDWIYLRFLESYYQRIGNRKREWLSGWLWRGGENRRRMRDPLTNLFNRTELFLDVAKACADKTKHPCAFLMIDVDNFKAINDAHGHPVGDQVLTEIAAAIIAVVGNGGRAYRHSGDEMAVLLENTNTGNAITLAEKMKTAIGQLTIPPLPNSPTVSVGVAKCDKAGLDPEAFVKMADEAAYAAKTAGRNCVRLASL